MKQTHTSYEVSKALKEFCPDLPEPMDKIYLCKCQYRSEEPFEVTVEGACLSYGEHDCCANRVPAYQLHDLLSKEFCEKMAEKHPHIEYFKSNEMDKDLPWEILTMLCEDYYNGGLPAVEKALMEIMK